MNRKIQNVHMTAQEYEHGDGRAKLPLVHFGVRRAFEAASTGYFSEFREAAREAQRAGRRSVVTQIDGYNLGERIVWVAGPYPQW